jgi:cell division protein ZapA
LQAWRIEAPLVSNVKLQIGGREFTVACSPGEEEHVQMLGRRIDDKVHAAGTASGSSDSRMLLFAALLLADEVHELRHGDETTVPPPDNSAELARICQSVETAAGRIEKLASDLESAATPA